MARPNSCLIVEQGPASVFESLLGDRPGIYDTGEQVAFESPPLIIFALEIACLFCWKLTARLFLNLYPKWSEGVVTMGLHFCLENKLWEESEASLPNSSSGSKVPLVPLLSTVSLPGSNPSFRTHFRSGPGGNLPSGRALRIGRVGLSMFWRNIW